ncbi:phospho-sugar mutase [Candidatus Woesearchaeota archaeon]|nr:phospho-sugar mutase [Candidatus Woesearchaeota archaeon]
MDVIKIVEQGFASLNVNASVKKQALYNLKEWLTNPVFGDYVAQIEFLIKSKMWDFLLDSFYQVIPFGTGGRRGLVGIGPNRINKWTVQASAQGHSQYLIAKYARAVSRGVVLAYDTRVFCQKGVYDDALFNPVMYLDGKKLAIAAAEVYAGNGIPVYVFSSPRTTPELSFAVRYFKAVAGDVFSASHNLSSDNGKKVYDENGGQLIPPYDQYLVDEVTTNVKEIKTIDFEKARRLGIIKFIGKEVDAAYISSAMRVSLSKERAVKVVYSPMHGTGITSVYPVLKKLGFKPLLDPVTKKQSGLFEGILFNIPNPEVEQAFSNSIPFAQKAKADLLLGSDPDADRIGAVVFHNNEWRYLNGNELAILLTDYAVKNRKGVVIKTEVTTTLVETICKKHNVQCIPDLLVGFKYIANEMNLLEKCNKLFLFGAEESHGYITGNYVRDKDAVIGAVWLCEYAAILKKDKKTLIDRINEIYSEYGLCLNYLTEIRLLGAEGMAQIAKIMDFLRTPLKSFGEFEIILAKDRQKGSKHLSQTDSASRNMLVFLLEPKSAESIRVIVRPSGTEPKLKIYIEILSAPQPGVVSLEHEKIVRLKNIVEKTVMNCLYRVLGVDFPERGFLLFAQLPLNAKMHYFGIEESIAELAVIKNDSMRKKKLSELLAFLGKDPVQKVDEAFKARYGKGINAYLNL